MPSCAPASKRWRQRWLRLQLAGIAWKFTSSLNSTMREWLADLRDPRQNGLHEALPRAARAPRYPDVPNRRPTSGHRTYASETCRETPESPRQLEETADHYEGDAPRDARSCGTSLEVGPADRC